MKLETATDRELLKALSEHSPLAGKVFYQRHVKGIYKFCHAVLGNRDWAEDATQHFFLSILKNIEQYLKADDVTVYLYSCARHEAYRILKQEKKQVDPEKIGLSGNLNVKPAFIDMDDDLRELLGTLPEEQKEIVYLKCLRDMTFREIASISMQSINTVMSRYRLAMEKLKTSGKFK